LHMSKLRPGRAPPLSRGRWCAPGRRLPSGRHPPLSCGQSLRPRKKQPIGGGHLHETSSKVHSRSPITPRRLAAAPGPGSAAASRRSSPRLPPPDGTRAASASSPGSAPRSYPRRTPGRRRANAHWPRYCAPGISRASNGTSHLNSCTLTSHIVASCLHHHPGHPRQRSQSRSPSSAGVVVAQVRTSWRRAPGLDSCGTRTHAVSVVLPISSAATRSTSSAGSSVTSSMTMVLSMRADSRRLPAGVKRGFRGGIACSGQQCRTPVAGSQRPDSYAGSAGTKHHRRRRATTPIFMPAGRHRRDINDSYVKTGAERSCLDSGVGGPVGRWGRHRAL
jgi:hypothetical protein